MGDGRELSGVDKLLLATIVDFVISGQELLQFGLDVVVAERGSSGTAFTLLSHLLKSKKGVQTLINIY